MTGVVRGGPLDPPGPPASTLPQVEPRSPIPPVGWNGTFPIVIDEPGSYFLTRPLQGVAGTDGIHITSGSVTLDLNGFALTGPGRSGTSVDGTAVLGTRAGIHISNGVIRDWDVGINGWNNAPDEAVFSRVDHVTVLFNFTGIKLGFDSEITDCNVSQNTEGIFTHFSVVRDCHVTDNIFGITAWDVSLVEGNKVWNNGIGIEVGSISQPGNNTVRFNTATNNATTDIEYQGTGNVSDSNVVTCPGLVTGAGVATYNQMHQRNPC
jgi:hypothetical protein